MTERSSVVVSDLASTFFYLLGSLIGLVLAVWTLWHEEYSEEEEQGQKSDDDDIFYNAVPYRTFSCMTATCYLLDVALDVENHRRSNITAWWFGIGACLELTSTILNVDWIMVMAVHAYLASAVLILTKPPDGIWEGRADILFGIGCGFDVTMSYCYWNETLYDVLLYGDVLSAIFWCANAVLVTMLAVSSLACDVGGGWWCCREQYSSRQRLESPLDDHDDDDDDDEDGLHVNNRMEQQPISGSLFR
jgi:hypothetical protein